MISVQPLSREIVWLVQYDAPGQRVAMVRLIECFGREAVAD
jgi:hypothetical protein